VGISISCRYTPGTGGFFFRVTPWLFILPGLQLLSRLLARLFNFLLRRVEELETKATMTTTTTTTRTRAGGLAASLEAEREEEPALQEQETEQERQREQLLLASASARRFKVSAVRKKLMCV